MSSEPPYPLFGPELDRKVAENFDRINSQRDTANLPEAVRSNFSAEAFSPNVPKTAAEFAQKAQLVYAAADGFAMGQGGVISKDNLAAVAEKSTNPGIKAAAEIVLTHYDELATSHASSYKTHAGSRTCGVKNRVGQVLSCPPGYGNFGISSEQITSMLAATTESWIQRKVEAYQQEQNRLPSLLKWTSPWDPEKAVSDAHTKRDKYQAWVDQYNSQK